MVSNHDMCIRLGVLGARLGAYLPHQSEFFRRLGEHEHLCVCVLRPFNPLLTILTSLPSFVFEG